MNLNIFIASLLSFFIGSIPFGLIISKYFYNIDIKEHGSKNIGATNVCRVVGKKAALSVFVLDALKGTLALYLYPNFYIAIAVILGHIFSPFLKFKGGKGVATAIGCYLYLYPIYLLICSFVWLIVFISTKTSSISSLVSFFVIAQMLWTYDIQSGVFGNIIFVILLYSHRENIKRILNKEELKI